MKKLVFILLAVCLEVTNSFSEHIKGPPIAKEKEIKKIVRVGEDVKVQCPIFGNPLPIIEWKKGEDIIDYSWIRIRTKNKSMRIKKSKEEDTGVYVCKGVNGFGSIDVKVNIIVIDPSRFPELKDGELPELNPPQFTSLTMDSRSFYHKKTGDSFRISCEAKGNPQPDILWYKDGHPFDTNGLRLKDGKSTLKMRNIMLVDSAVYTCQAKNIIGNINKNFSLFVEPQSINEPSVTGSGNITVLAGDTASLTCKVNSIDPPHIKWLKKQVPGSPEDLFTIKVGNEQYRVVHSGNDVPIGTDGYINKLVIHNAHEQDSGLYICFVTNSGKGFNYKPSFLQVLPTKTVIERNNNSRENSPESMSLLLLVIALGIIVVLILIFIIANVIKKNHKKSKKPTDSSDISHSLMVPSISTESSSSITTGNGSNKFDEPLPPPPSIWSLESTMEKGKFIGRDFNQLIPENSSTNLLSDCQSPNSPGDHSSNMYEVPYCGEYGDMYNHRLNNSLYTIGVIPGINSTLTSTGTLDTEGNNYPFRQYPYFQHINSDYNCY